MIIYIYAFKKYDEKDQEVQGDELFPNGLS